MTTAKFKINGTPSAPRGFDATNGQVLTLQLETNPAPDVYKVAYSLYDPNVPNSPLASKNAPTVVTVPSSGEPTVPTGTVTCTMPGAGVHSYGIRCVINDGVDQALGVRRPEWIYERIVSIRSANGQRKQLPGESIEYSARGWSDAQNEAVDAPGGASKFSFPLQACALGTSLATSANKLALGAAYVDPAVLSGVSMTFEAIIETSLATNVAFIDLEDLTTHTVVASSQLSTAANVPTRVTVSLPAVLAASARLYQARLWMAPLDPAQVVTCRYAALVISTS